MARRALAVGTLLLVLAQSTMLGGCAGNVPRVQQSKDHLLAYYLDADDQPTLLIATAPGVVATDRQKDHLASLLTERLDMRRSRNLADGNARQCEVQVLVTRLDGSGNVTRGFLVGLGQVHLEASVLVMPAGGGEPLDAFRISKTFTWHGTYGTSEGARDLEPAFADEIAAALTDQPAEAE